MGDYSAHVLDRARQEVAHHGDHVSGLVLEATRLSGPVGFLAGKAFLVYISNVYDNLPGDEIAAIQGRMYLVQTRSYLSEAAADSIATRFELNRSDIAQLTERLLRIGPELLAESQPDKFPDTGQAVLFWQDVWDALRQAERYVPLEGLEDLRLIKEYAWPSALGLGVIDVKSPSVESPDLVAARIRRALEYVDLARLVVNPDYGLRHLAPEVARNKLRAMVSGAAIVRSELSRPSTSPSPATGDSASQPTGDNNVG